jgi:hypothetical protein
MTNASVAAVAPPVNAAPAIFPAIAPIFWIGILAPNPSISFIFFGGFIFGTCGCTIFCKFF